MGATKGFVCGVVAGVLLVVAAGCSSSPRGEAPAAFQDEGLEATRAAKVADADSTNLNQFEVFNGDFSRKNILENTSKIYAKDVWFQDSFKVIHGESGFESYLLREADAVGQFKMEWQDVAQDQGNYYFRWRMTLKLKHDKESIPPTVCDGMSMVRFGADGKVLFQHDYYDGVQLLYEKVPILGAEIRWVKSRL